jgi:uncharacterized delta-60 repeat protein
MGRPVTRVLSDGELDPGFVPPAIESYNTLTDSIVTTITPADFPVVYTTAIQPDGKILVGGSFFFINGKPGYGGLIRLNSDGSLDTSFNAPRFNGSVFSVVLLANGGFAVGGEFNYVGAKKSPPVVELASDGSLDKGFVSGDFAGIPPSANPFVTVAAVHTIVAQPDGKIIVGGIFTSIAGTELRGVARLTQSGSVDTSFTPDPGFNAAPTNGTEPSDYSVDQVLDLALQSDGKVIVVGSFVDPASPNLKSPKPVNDVYRLNSDGSFDKSFNPNGTGTNNIFPPPPANTIASVSSNPLVSSVVLQSDGKIIIAGAFVGYNDASTNLVARLNTDGTLDTSFDVGVGPAFSVDCLALQTNGKLLLGGNFNSVDGVVRKFAARLNTVAGPPAVVVHITAPKGDPENLRFKVIRSGGNPTESIRISYTIAGNAVPGVDYSIPGANLKRLTGEVTIVGGTNSSLVNILLGTTVPSNKKITLILVPTAAYATRVPRRASVVIPAGE